MGNYWDPNNYTLENQLSDMLRGKDVVTCNDGTVIKGDDNHVDVFWPSSSDRGHGHAGFDYDEDGDVTDSEIYHY